MVCLLLEFKMTMQELAEAEAKANKEALASQRANSLQKVPSREAQEANNIGEAEPFTEEALNSTVSSSLIWYPRGT